MINNKTNLVNMKVVECDGGCMTTLSDVNGVGNPVPAQMSATTAVDQSSPDCIGSGDKFGSSFPIASQAPIRKKRKVRFIRKNKGGL